MPLKCWDLGNYKDKRLYTMHIARGTVFCQLNGKEIPLKQAIRVEHEFLGKITVCNKCEKSRCGRCK